MHFSILILGLFFSFKSLSQIDSPDDLYRHVDQSFLKFDHVDLKEALKNKVLSPALWQQKINESVWDFLCVGEKHDQKIRDLISLNILEDLKIDHLLLETQGDTIPTLLSDYAQTGSAQLLGAPLTSILKTVYKTNPEIKISGVEQTSAQAFLKTQETIKFQRGKLSREAFIAQNIVDSFQKGEKTLALYGALHCSFLNEGLGLDTPFFLLMGSYFKTQGLKTSNIKIIQAADHRVLTALLRQYGYLKREPIILTELQSLDPRYYNYQVDLFKLFKGFENIVLIP